MTAKEYLSQVSKLDAWIHIKQRQVEDLREKLTATGGTDYSRDRVKSSLPADPLADRIAEYVALEDKLNKQIDRYIDLRDRITCQINALEDTRYIRLLSMRYLDGMPLVKIAESMSYDYKWLCVMHGKALQAFEKKYLV